MARTQSPPYPGLDGGLTKLNGGVLVQPNLSSFFAIGFGGLGAAYLAGNMSSSIGQEVVANDGHGTKYVEIPGLFANFYIPLVPLIPYQISFNTVNPSHFVTSTTENVQLAAGQVKTLGTVISTSPLVTADHDAPVVTSISLDFNANGATDSGPEIVLIGSGFIDLAPDPSAPSVNGHVLGTVIGDLRITLRVGGEDGLDENGDPQANGGLDIVIDPSTYTFDAGGGAGLDKLSFPVPASLAVGTAQIIVSRPASERDDTGFQTVYHDSATLQLEPTGTYVFAALPAHGAVSVIDSSHISSLGLSNPDEAARVAVDALDPNSDPNDIASTADDTRAYVTLAGDAGVAMVDAISLQEVDLDPNTPGTQHIALPYGSTPYDIVCDSAGKYAYVSDSTPHGGVGLIYVIDIDPFDDNYNKLVKTITVGTAPLGLRGLSLNQDGSLLYITAPDALVNGPSFGSTGTVFVVNTDPELKDGPAYTPDLFASQIQVGPGPISITATSDPNVMLFTDEVDDGRGLGILKRFPNAGNSFTVNYVNLLPFGLNGVSRASQVFGVSNAADVVFVAATSTAPSYAFITGYNRYTADDPKHDATAGETIAKSGYLTYKSPVTNSDGSTSYVIKPLGDAVVAGGNVGIIRNPLGDPSDPNAGPRLIAATRGLINGFPGQAAISPDGSLLFVGYQGLHEISAYSIPQIISTIEADKAGINDPTQTALSNLPIDDIPPAGSDLSNAPLVNLFIDVAADQRFYTDPTYGDLVFGIPPTEAGLTTNPFAPLQTGDDPRGLTGQLALSGQPLENEPLNEIPTIDSPGEPNTRGSVPIGLTSQALLGTGDFQETANLDTYTSLGVSRGISLVYNSVNADPNQVYHFTFPNVTAATGKSLIVASLEVYNHDPDVDYDKTAPGFDPDKAADPHGLEAGDNFFAVTPGQNLGAALSIDLSDADPGVYTAVLTTGELTDNGTDYVGRRSDLVTPLALNSEVNGPFGSGWGIAGVQRLYDSSDSDYVMIADGNGGALLFREPEKEGQAFSSPAGDTSTLVQDAGTGVYTRTMSDGTVYKFDEKGHLQTLTDRNGNATTYTYVGDNLSAIQDPLGLTTRLTYSGDLVTSISDPAGRTTRFQYSGKTLSSITNPDGSTTNYQYDANELMTKEVNVRGNTETMTYSTDNAGRLVSATDVEGRNETLSAGQTLGLYKQDQTDDYTKALQPLVDLSSEKAKFTDAANRETDYVIDAYGKYVSSSSDAGKQVTDTRDGEERIVTETDAAGNVTSYTYDLKGNILSQTDQPVGGTATTQLFTYSSDNRLTSKTDSLGRTTTFTYDGNGNILSQDELTADLGDVKSTYTYNGHGQLLTQTDPLGHITTYTYDPTSGNIASVTTASGTSAASTTRNTYDSAGNVATTIDGSGNPTTYTYDAENRPLTQSDALGDVVSNAYDAAGNLTEETDADGNETQYAYDPFNRLNHQTNANGGVVTDAYDVDGNLLESTDPLGGTTVNTFDDNDDLLTTTDPTGAKTTFTYDDLGRKLSSTTPTGNTTSFQYDADGRLVAQINPDRGTETFEYDTAGRLTASTDALGNRSQFGYDSLDHRTSVTDALGKVTTFTYDADGNLTQTIDAAGNVTKYAYDARNENVSTISAAGTAIAQTTTFAYDGAGHQVQEVDAAGSSVARTTTTAYDAAGRPTSTSQTGVAGGASASTTTMVTYDDNGNVTSQTSAAGTAVASTKTTTYDELNDPVLVTDAAGTGAATQTHFKYDLDTNRTEVVTAYGTAAATMFTYLFDGDGRSTSITSGDGTPAAETTRTLYSLDGQVTDSYNARGYDTHTDYDANDRPITTTAAYGTSAAATTRTVYDKEGHTTQVTDPLGHVTAMTYDADGRLLTTTSAVGTPEATTTAQTYDAVGNVTETDTGVGTAYERSTTTTFDALKRPVSQTTAAGSPMAQTSTTTYDALGQATDVVYAAGTSLATTTHTDFTALGQRADEIDASGTPEARETTFEYDAAQNLTDQVTNAGTPQAAETTYAYDALGRQVKEIDLANNAAEALETDNTYDAAGQLSDSIVGSNTGLSRDTHYEHNAQGDLTVEIDGYGSSDAVETDTQYDADDNATQVTVGVGTANPRVTTSTFDPLDRPVSTTANAGTAAAATSLDTYDGDSNVTDETQFAGSSSQIETTYQYNALNQQISQTAGVGSGQLRTSSTQYDPYGDVVQSTDPLGNVDTATFDAAGNQTGETDAVGTPVQRSNSVTFNVLGEKTSATNFRGDPTLYTYDTLGQITSVTNPAGGVTSSVYDAAGNLTSQTDADGVVTSSTFDLAGRPVTQTGGGVTTQTAYDALGNVVSSTDGRGMVTNYGYDNLGRQTSVTTPDNETSTTKYDAFGDAIAIADAAGQNQTRTYDGNGNVLSVSDALDETTNYAYDDAGHLLKTTDALGHHSSSTYDVYGDVTSTTDGAGNTTKFTYDADGNTATLTDPVNNVESYGFDALNRLVSDSNANGTQTYTYDADNDETGTVDRDGQQTTFTYDPLGDRTGETWVKGGANGTDVVFSTAYTDAGRPTSIVGPGSSIDYTYDHFGNVGNVVESIDGGPVNALTYGYDAAGNIATVSQSINGVAAAVTAYTYNSDELVSFISKTGPGVTPISVGLSYTADQLPSGETRYNGADATGTAVFTSAYTRDLAGRITAITNTTGVGGAGTPLDSFTFAYDKASRMAVMTDGDGTADYGYTVNDELASAGYTDTAIPGATYTYDANGNRLSTSATGTYTIGADNELTSDNSSNYTYDADGNVLTSTNKSNGQVRTFTYDFRNRLTSVTDANADGTFIQQVQYAYDALNRRISEAVSTGAAVSATTPIKYFLYDHANIVTDMTAAGAGQTATITEQYLYGPETDELLAQQNADGSVDWTIADAGNTIHDLVNNATGLIDNHLVYDAFGVLISQDAAGGAAPGGGAAATVTVATRYGFDGREYDAAVGLYYFRARFYDPDTGRFVTQDPQGYGGGDTNLYRFAGNNPATLGDPTGNSATFNESTGEDVARFKQRNGVYSGVLDQAPAQLAQARVQSQQLQDNYSRIAENPIQAAYDFASYTFVDAVKAFVIEPFNIARDVYNFADAEVFSSFQGFFDPAHSDDPIGSVGNYKPHSDLVNGIVTNGLLATAADLIIGQVTRKFQLITALATGDLEGAANITASFIPAPNAREILKDSFTELAVRSRAGFIRAAETAGALEKAAPQLAKAFKPGSIEEARFNDSIKVTREWEKKYVAAPESEKSQYYGRPEEAGLVGARDRFLNTQELTDGDVIAILKKNPKVYEAYQAGDATALALGGLLKNADVFGQPYIDRVIKSVNAAPNIEYLKSYGLKLPDDLEFFAGLPEDKLDQVAFKIHGGNGATIEQLSIRAGISKGIISGRAPLRLLNGFGFNENLGEGKIDKIGPVLSRISKDFSKPGFSGTSDAEISSIAYAGTKINVRGVFNIEINGKQVPHVLYNGEPREIDHFYSQKNVEGSSYITSDRGTSYFFPNIPLGPDGRPLAINVPGCRWGVNPLTGGLGDVAAGFAQYGVLETAIPKVNEFYQFGNITSYSFAGAYNAFTFAGGLGTYAQFGANLQSGLSRLPGGGGGGAGPAGHGATGLSIVTGGTGGAGTTTSGGDGSTGTTGSTGSTGTGGGSTSGTTPLTPFEQEVATLGADAMAYWQGVLGLTSVPALTTRVAYLPAGELAMSGITSVDAGGHSLAGSVVVGITGDGQGWYVDPDPTASAAYDVTLGTNAFHAAAGADSLGKYDLFTAMLHETAQLLGFTDADAAYASRVSTSSSGENTFVAGATRVPLDTTADNLTGAPLDLMVANLAVSTRKLPSATDVAVLQAVHALSTGDIITLQPHVLYSTADANAAAGTVAPITLPTSASHGLLNGTFTDLNPTDAGFGWQTDGNVSFATGHATLGESSSHVLSQLLQGFVVPSGATQLQFTVDASSLLANGINPSDAFQVELLDAAGHTPLVGPPTALPDTDALLNWQQNGLVQTAAGVSSSITPVNGSLSTASPVTFTVNLAGIASGSQVLLGFDLLGFAPATSDVLVSNVKLVSSIVTKVAPTINLTAGTFTYDGNTHAATAEVFGASNTDLGPATLTYNGSTTLPTNAGTPGCQHPDVVCR